MSAAGRRPPPSRRRPAAPPRRAAAQARRPATRSRRPAPQSGRRAPSSDLGLRLAVAVPAAIVAVVAIWTSAQTFLLLLAAVGLVALHELYALVGSARPVRIAGFVALLAVLLAGDLGSERQILLVALVALPLTFLLHVARPPQGNVVGAVGSTLLGVYWIALPLGCAMLLRHLPHGAAIVTDVAVGTFLGDTGAYLVGRAIGRRPLALALSPNKTREGLIGGIVIGTFAVYAAGWWQDWLSGGQALALGVAVALAAPVGDLFESAVKRAAGTKDSGTLFGAHGGALDRIDAVLFSAVAGYFVWRSFA